MRIRFFILGPIIVALAFTLHSKVLTVMQVGAGITYTALGFLTRRK